jgi:hypothetical protein
MARPHYPGEMLRDYPSLPLVPRTLQAPHRRREGSAVLSRPMPESLLHGLPSLGSAGGSRWRPKSGGNQESLASNVHVGYSARLPIGAPGEADKVVASATPRSGSRRV